MNHPTTTRLSSWRRLVFGLALLLGLCALTGGLARPAHALSKFSVSNCSSDAQLQADVAQANHDNAGDVITFACSGDIKLSSTLTISGSMTLSGRGQQVTLDGGGSVQVLYVHSGVSFTLNALTIAHGVASYNQSAGFYLGGGLANEGGTVTISNSTFAYNAASYGRGGGLSNGDLNNVYPRGTVTISNSTFANNSADDGGGGLANDFGTMSISNSTFTNNSGGGLDNGDTLSISNSTIANNSTSGDGGGLYNGGTASISNSTFAYNSAPGYGGGIENFNYATVTISNSTVANNSASQGGGGINSRGGTASISNSTVANNSAPNGSGLFNFYETVSISGSIVAENTGGGGDCLNISDPSVGGSITDGGYNLSSDSSCGFTGTGSLQNTNPKLGPLASNGGPTQTMALLKGSPASDVIPLTSRLCPATDQRGHKRPDNSLESACDIGAYES